MKMKLLFLMVLCGMLPFQSAAAPHFIYQPVKLNAEAGNWQEVNRQLDSIETAFPDSVMVPLTSIYVAKVMQEKDEIEVLRIHAYRLLHYFDRRSDFRIPPIEDPLWALHIEDEVYHTKRYASRYLSDIFFAEKQYDSCLRYIDFTEPNFVYNTRYNDKSIMALHLHRVYRKSVCLEMTGEPEKARLVLLPYLFLDDVETDTGRFNHKNCVMRYVDLQRKYGSPPLDKEAMVNSMKNLEFIPADSLVLPSGWREYYTWKNCYAVKVEGFYVPVVFSYLYWLDHPRPAADPLKVENPVLRQLNPEEPAKLPKENPEDAAYMRDYLRQTLLFRQ